MHDFDNLPEVPELDDMPTPRSLGAVRKALLTVLATFGAYVLITAAAHVWGLKADRSTVEQMANDVHEIRASMARVEVKVDSQSLRITQIRCGKDVENGCR